MRRASIIEIASSQRGKSLLARIVAALHRSRRKQARRLLRSSRHLTASHFGAQPATQR